MDNAEAAEAGALAASLGGLHDVNRNFICIIALYIILFIVPYNNCFMNSQILTQQACSACKLMNTKVLNPLRLMLYVVKLMLFMQ